MSAAAPPVARAQQQDVLLVFEGGGAKGLVHVGALHAIAAPGRLVPRGHAGTSAGAMVATLAAVGYGPADLLDIDGTRPPRPDGRPASILDILGIASAHLLFGEKGWTSLAAFRRVMGMTAWLVPGLIAWLLASFALGALWHPGVGLWGIALLLLALAGLAVRLLFFGVSLDPVRDAFQTAIAQSPRMKGRTARRADGVFTFRDLDDAGVVLKLCASNLSRRRLEVFSAETTPDVAVADAVAASICFPFAFRPRRIRMPHAPGAPVWTFVDGGLLSNLPAWCLDEERRLDPGLLTLAVAIDGDETTARPLRGAAWVGAMLRTALVGGQVLSLRGAGRVEVLRVDTDVDVFGFDIGWDAALDAVRKAREATAFRLAAQVLDLPDGARARTEAARARIAAWLRSRAVPGAPPPGAPLVRVAYAVPEDHVGIGFRHDRPPAGIVRSLTLRYGAGFEGAADAGLVIPVWGTEAGSAWHDRMPTLRFLDPPGALYTGGAPGDADRQARVPRDLAWLVAFPAVLPSIAATQGGRTVTAAVVIDSCHPPGDTPAERAAFQGALLSLIVGEIMPIFASA